MSNWEIGIYADSRTGSMGNDYFRICKDFSHLEQPYYWIDSKCFNNLTPEMPCRMMSVIHGLVLIANGAFALKTGNLSKMVDLDYGSFLYDEKRTSITSCSDFIPAMNPFEESIPNQISLHSVSCNNVFDTITASVKFPAIREILIQIGTIVDEHNLNRNLYTWTALYAIADTIQFYSKAELGMTNQEKIIKHFGYTKAEYSNFSHTANCYDYLGIYARHGRKAEQPPSMPMPLGEAINFIFNFADRFITFYIQEKKNL